MQAELVTQEKVLGPAGRCGEAWILFDHNLLGVFPQF